jgi:hypothetical protein
MCVRRPGLLLSPPGGDGSAAADARPLSIDGILLRLQAASGLFPFRKLAITHTEQLQAANSGRFTRHVELQLPEGMTYKAGVRRRDVGAGWHSAELLLLLLGMAVQPPMCGTCL